MGKVWTDVFNSVEPGQFSNLTDKPSPIGSDRLVIEDSEAQGGKKSATLTSLLSGSALTNAVFPTYAVFDEAFAANATVNFANGNKQAIANATGLSLTFSAPGPGSFILDLTTNSDALTEITTTVLWDSGTVPTWAGRSIIALYYDGTTWFGSALVGLA